MITERNATENLSSNLSALSRYWLSRRQVFVLAGAAIAAAGLALNWNWLTAAGVAPILLSLAPCAAMCALGLCMRGGGAKSCAAHSKADARTLPRSPQE